MVGVQKAAIAFDRKVVRTEPDPTRRAVFERLRSAESRRARAVAGMLPWTRSALEDALAHEQAAVDMDVWVARAEPEPQRRDIYQCDALEDFGHLYRYADALDLVAHGRERDLDEVVAVLPDRWGQPAAGAAGPGGVATTALSAFNTLTTLAVQRQVADFYDHVDTRRLDPPARPVYRAVRRVDRERIARRQLLIDWPDGLWEQLVIREYNDCRMYHAILVQESSPRVRAVWEVVLQEKLGQLQDARTMLRRYENREAEELVGTALPEPPSFGDNRNFLRRLLASYLDPDRLGAQTTREIPYVRSVWQRQDARRTAAHGTDAVAAAIDQHRQIEALFYEVEAAPADRRETPFATLIDLIAEHEAAEDESVHRLVRDHLPGGLELIRDLHEEERTLRQILLRLINTGARADTFEDDLVNLRDAFLAHVRHEERSEFVELRHRMPSDVLQQAAEPLRVPVAS